MLIVEIKSPIDVSRSKENKVEEVANGKIEVITQNYWVQSEKNRKNTEESLRKVGKSMH